MRTHTPFVMIDDAERRKAIEGVPNVLAQEIEQEERFFSTLSCPRCHGGGLQAQVDASRPFQQGKILPRKLLVCANCDTAIEPYTKITVKEGRTPEDVLRAASLYIHRS